MILRACESQPAKLMLIVRRSVSESSGDIVLGLIGVIALLDAFESGRVYEDMMIGLVEESRACTHKRGVTGSELYW